MRSTRIAGNSAEQELLDDAERRRRLAAARRTQKGRMPRQLGRLDRHRLAAPVAGRADDDAVGPRSGGAGAEGAAVDRMLLSPTLDQLRRLVRTLTLECAVLAGCRLRIDDGPGPGSPAPSLRLVKGRVRLSQAAKLGSAPRCLRKLDRAIIVRQSESSTTTRRPPPVINWPSCRDTAAFGLLGKIGRTHDDRRVLAGSLDHFLDLPAQPAPLCSLVANPRQDTLDRYGWRHGARPRTIRPSASASKSFAGVDLVRAGSDRLRQDRRQLRPHRRGPPS